MFLHLGACWTPSGVAPPQCWIQVGFSLSQVSSHSQSHLDQFSLSPTPSHLHRGVPPRHGKRGENLEILALPVGWEGQVGSFPGGERTQEFPLSKGAPSQPELSLDHFSSIQEPMLLPNPRKSWDAGMRDRNQAQILKLRTLGLSQGQSLTTGIRRKSGENSKAMVRTWLRIPGHGSESQDANQSPRTRNRIPGHESESQDTNQNPNLPCSIWEVSHRGGWDIFHVGQRAGLAQLSPCALPKIPGSVLSSHPPLPTQIRNSRPIQSSSHGFPEWELSEGWQLLAAPFPSEFPPNPGRIQPNLSSKC